MNQRLSALSFTLQSHTIKGRYVIARRDLLYGGPTLGDMVPKLLGCHYHELIDPAWFGLWDFKVMLLEKPGAAPLPAFQETKGFRWYSQR
jgi:hypothetical protein